MKHSWTLLILALVPVSAAVGQAVAQATKSSPPPNAWMKTPTDASAPDDVPAPVRMRRDQVWDGLIGARFVLTPETAPQDGISEGSFLGKPAEILEVPNRAVLIGRFTGYRSVLTFICARRLYRSHNNAKPGFRGRFRPTRGRRKRDHHFSWGNCEELSRTGDLVSNAAANGLPATEQDLSTRARISSRRRLLRLRQRLGRSRMGPSGRTPVWTASGLGREPRHLSA